MRIPPRLGLLVFLALARPAAADAPAAPPSLARANAAAAQGHWAEAADEYRRALALEPDFPALQADADALTARSTELQDRVFAAQRAHDDSQAAETLAAKNDADRRLRSDLDALASRGAFAQAHANFGIALGRLGRDAESLTQFGAALKLSPALGDRVRPLQAAAHLRLGRDQAAQGRAGAAAEYQQAVKLAPALAPAHAGLGALLLAQGRAEEAAAEMREALRLAPADARLLLGTVLVQAGRAEDARTQWQFLAQSPARGGDPAVGGAARRLLDQHPAAPVVAPAKPAEDPDVEAARDRLRSSPRDPMAHNDLGLALHRAGRDAAALAELRESVHLEPESDLAHTNLGLVLGAAGQTEAAMQQYRHALKISPEDWAAHNNLGALFYDQGRWREAEAQFRAAVRAARNDPGAHLNLGSALMAQDRTAEAAQEFGRAARLDPHLAAAHANLGFAWDRLGRAPDAVAEYRQAVALVPDRAQAFLDMARALRDLPGHAAGRAGAVASYRAVMRLFPDHAAAHAGLAELLLAAGDAEAAGAEFQAALWRQPDLAPAYAGLGRVRMGQDRPGDAARACRQALALDPADALTRNTLGLALYQSGDKAGARRQWQQVAAGDDPKAARNAAGLMQEFP